MTAYLKAEVGPGMFSSEKAVNVYLGGKRVTLLCDESFTKPGGLRVTVLERSNTEAFIELPADPFQGFRRGIVSLADLFSGA